MDDFRLTSVITALSADQVPAEQKLVLSEINHDALIECHRHTAIALFNRVFRRRTGPDIKQLLGGLAFVEQEILRRLGHWSPDPNGTGTAPMKIEVGLIDDPTTRHSTGTSGSAKAPAQRQPPRNRSRSRGFEL